MKKFCGLRSFVGLSALIACVNVGQAQVLTVDTLPSTVANFGQYLGNGRAMTQTFTGASGLGEVTFRFIVASGSLGSVTGGALDVMLTQWDTGTGNSMGVSIGSAAAAFVFGSAGAWTNQGAGSHYFDSTADLSSFGALNPAFTYGISLFANVGTAAQGILVSNSSEASYAGGTSFADLSTSFGDASTLGSGNVALGLDLSFSSTAASPVPEASSAAVLFAGAFVGGLVLRRRPRGTTAPQVA